MALPRDPAAFISAAERGINERDLEATAGVYAADAKLEAVTDGALEVYTGADAIRRCWDAYLGAFEQRDFTLEKRLTAVDGDTIVNEWSGSVGGRTDAQGIEYWRFDDAGKVREHRMLSFLNVRSSKTPSTRVRLGLMYPVTALALLREQRRAGATKR